MFQSLLSLLGAKREPAPPPEPEPELSAAVAEYLQTNWEKPSPAPQISVHECQNIRFRIVDSENLNWPLALYHNTPKRASPVPFAAHVMRLISDRHLCEVTVYKKARLDKRQFARIRRGACSTNDVYTPSKTTALALALALELSLEETETLLKKAGLALSDAIKSDVIVRYFLENRIYCVDKVNSILHANGCALLGSRPR